MLRPEPGPEPASQRTQWEKIFGPPKVAGAGGAVPDPRVTRIIDEDKKWAWDDVVRKVRRARIGLVILCTGKYAGFVPALVASAARHVNVPDMDLSPVLLTDSAGLLAAPPAGAIALPARHHPWPAAMLRRYAQILEHEEFLRGYEFLLHIDADMEFVGPVGAEILSAGLLATESPNLPAGRRQWFTGSLLGGETVAFLGALKEVQASIQSSPVRTEYPEEYWWNMWLDAHPPDVVLDGMYCFPDRPARKGQEPKIVTITPYRDNLKARIEKEKASGI